MTKQAKSEIVQGRVEPGIRKELQIMADLKNLTESEIVRLAVIEYINRYAGCRSKSKGGRDARC